MSAKEQPAEKEVLISQTSVMQLGFTKSMIDLLLPEPILKRNPHYACAAPMKLWKESGVHAVMETEAFQRASEKAARRKKSSEKAVEAKRQSAETLLDEIIKSLEVVRLDMPDLEKQTLDAKQNWYDWHSGDLIIDPPKEAVERWMVNFVRHRLCQYDGGLMDIFGKVGKRELYRRLKIETLKKISDVYPELKDECDRQICNAAQAF